LGVKILKFFDEDPGSGMETVRIRDKYPGSATLGETLSEGSNRRLKVAKLALES
jgi:hypothetical protein